MFVRFGVRVTLTLTLTLTLRVAANVHGNEQSGCDAALQVAYELSDRSDAAAQLILDNAIVVILPVQNPGLLCAVIVYVSWPLRLFMDCSFANRR